MTKIKGTFKFRIRWDAYKDKWCLQVEHKSYDRDFFPRPEPEWSIWERLFGLRAMWRYDRKQTYWDRLYWSSDMEALKEKAEEFVATKVAEFKEHLEAEARAKRNSQIHDFVIEVEVE